MTLANAPWALDGATIGSSLARLASFAALGGAEGVIQRGDLKVSQLATPGQGLLVAAGGAIILNRYQTTPNQAYVVSNPTVHTITSGSMPASNPSTKYYLVCITVGDPEFSQVGHPWMTGSDPAAGTESTFQYVRPFIVECTSTTTDFGQLGLAYPALALARLAVPPSTTTITNAMITDLRALASPKSWEALTHSAGGAATLNGAGGVSGTWQQFPPNDILQVKIPSWAVKAKVTGFVEGLRLNKAGVGKLRVTIKGEAKSTAVTNWDEYTPNTVDERASYNVGGEIDVTSLQGQTVTWIVEGMPNNDASKGALKSDANTSVQIRVYFEEVPT